MGTAVVRRTRTGADIAVGLVLLAATLGLALSSVLDSEEAGRLASTGSPARTASAERPSPAAHSIGVEASQGGLQSLGTRDPHCAGFLFGYRLAYERLALPGGHAPGVASPDRATCPRLEIISMDTPLERWCVGAMTAVSLFWSSPDVTVQVREIAEAVEQSCLPNEWWRRDPSMVDATATFQYIEPA